MAMLRRLASSPMPMATTRTTLFLIGMAEEKKGDHAAAVAHVARGPRERDEADVEDGGEHCDEDSGRRLRSIGNRRVLRCHCDIVGARSTSQLRMDCLTVAIEEEIKKGETRRVFVQRSPRHSTPTRPSREAVRG